MPDDLQVIASKVFRTGKQSLLYSSSNSQWYIHLLNRTNDTLIPLPEEKVEIWKSLLS